MEAEGTGRRSARDMAALLPFVGIFLLVPPVILIFAKPVLIAGVPLIVVYLFGVWAAAILCAMVVAHHLAGEDRGGGAEPADEGRAR